MQVLKQDTGLINIKLLQKWLIYHNYYQIFRLKLGNNVLQVVNSIVRVLYYIINCFIYINKYWPWF